MKQDSKKLPQDSNKSTLDKYNEEYKAKMKTLMPEYYKEEKTFEEKLNDKLEHAKKEHSDTRGGQISQFWYGQWRALEWVKKELGEENNDD